jgi:cellulose synthase/poly-beta-1,6-N-acetylglucosamine synthase-like glycosyltransferase
VVANDAGGPAVERVVSSVDGRLRMILVTPERSGPSGARNAGASAAHGRFIAFTDDDTEPAPGWLPALESALRANPGAAVGGETRNGGGKGAAAASQAVVDAVHAHYNRDTASPRFFASNNIAFPADGFWSVGGFNEDLRHAEDRELCERWIRTGHRLVYEPAALVYHMRKLTLPEFFAQHYGYGRGAWVFAHGQGVTARHDRGGVLRALVREALRPSRSEDGAPIAAYMALSQLATAAGFGREAVAARWPRAR